VNDSWPAPLTGARDVFVKVSAHDDVHSVVSVKSALTNGSQPVRKLHGRHASPHRQLAVIHLASDAGTALARLDEPIDRHG